jgi:putative copper export protein
MTFMGGQVPMFKLRPYHGFLITAVLVLVVGGLLSAYFFIEDVYASRGIFVLLVTLISFLLLVTVAFSRYGFRHLRQHRPGYKRG